MVSSEDTRTRRQGLLTLRALLQVHLCRGLDAVAAPLLPENFLVSHADVIPGILRTSKAGKLTTHTSGTATNLRNPAACKTAGVVIQDLSVVMPSDIRSAFLSSMHDFARDGRANWNGTESRHGELRVDYVIRAGAHNGMRAVGTWARCGASFEEGGSGKAALRARGTMAVGGVPGDACVVIVVEVLMVARKRKLEEAVEAAECVALWGAFPPYSLVDPGGASVVQEGLREVNLDIHQEDALSP
ncbi:unnamed protein product, partial [Ostreobium quekettii]